MANKPRSGLGRGLGDLIRPTSAPSEPSQASPGRITDAASTGHPDGTAAAGQGRATTGTNRGNEAEALDLVPAPSGAAFAEIEIERVTPNPKQPRQVFDEDDLAELSASIAEVGLLQPIVVRRAGGDYELVMGERRLRASKLAGLATIPAIIRDTDEHDLLRDALLENLHRAQLNPLEEAAAYQQMLDDFGCTQEELAARIKRSRPQISNTIRLLRLPAPVQRRVAAGVLSAGHARALLSLEDPMAQERLAQRIVAEGLSVRAVEELVALGERERVGRRPRAVRAPSPRAETLASTLTDSLDTRVAVQIGKNKGKITIEFAGEDDLERILTVLRQGVPTN
ncbi:ParB/RepB/Spo0J family partition protein [Propioniciclava soli]|uniref:ParB/RepB/Spo0J family partition protein n=1 Tax=Propioniciclava soli TaxID=2775081 RepID=UPI001E4E7044|nr:ParB/RepB/Spo0J family partition protein [Propioniciclava soli]